MMRILDIGSGCTPNKKAQVLVDKYLDNTSRCAKEIKIYPNQMFVQADVINLPFEDKQFDYVYFNQVIEHIDIKNIEKALKEIQRVGKEGYISCPTPLWEKLSGRKYHVNLVELVNNVLIIRNKPKDYCSNFNGYKLYKECELFRKAFDSNDHLFLVKYHWKDKINYKILDSENKTELKTVEWNEIDDIKDAISFVLNDGKGRSLSDIPLPCNNDILFKLTPYLPKRILDFGCGIGRNTIWISKYIPSCKNGDVWGYDITNMIELAKEYSLLTNASPEIKFTYKWDEVCKLKFDLVMSFLTLQHLEPSILENKFYPNIYDMLGDNGYFYIYGRDWSDYNSNEIVWDKLERWFYLVKEHPLSINYKRYEFKNLCQDGDHHSGIFKRRTGVVHNVCRKE